MRCSTQCTRGVAGARHARWGACNAHGPQKNSGGRLIYQATPGYPTPPHPFDARVPQDGAA
jgi:hypothetical protein